MKSEHECDNYGFYQSNYFCDMCRLLEPKEFNNCLKETKNGILNGRITKDKFEKK